MMMKKLDKKDAEYTINLATIEGDGSFPMPQMSERQFLQKTTPKKLIKSWTPK